MINYQLNYYQLKRNLENKADELINKQCKYDFILSALISEDQKNEGIHLSLDEIEAILKKSLKKADKAKNKELENQASMIAKDSLNQYQQTNLKKKFTDEDIKLKAVSEVEKKPIEWLIPGYIPKHGFTLLCSDGGVGKGFIWCDILASVTTGNFTFFEDQNLTAVPREPGTALYFTSEDETSRVIRQRLEDAKADLSKIHFIDLEDKRLKMVKFGSEYLEKIVAEYRPEIMIFDPLQSFIPPNVQMSQRNQMRDAMEPLAQLCTEYNTSAIVICHTNKRENAYGRNRVADSSDVWDHARSVLIAGNIDSKLKYLSHEKSNWDTMQDTVIFEIADGRTEIRETSKKKDKDFVLENRFSHSKEKSKPVSDDIKEVIINTLKENNNEMLLEDLNDYIINELGYRKDTYNRVRSNLSKEKIIDIKRPSQVKKGEKRKSIVKLLKK